MENKENKENNEKDKKKISSKNIWMYAVLLFTSAFVILVLTAYSQIKYNKERNNIQTTLQSEVAAKDTYKINLNQALEENKAIVAELEQYKQDNQAISDENASLKVENQKLRSDNAKIAKMYDRYAAADAYFINGDWTNSARMLFIDFDSSVLDKTAADRAAYIMTTVGAKVAENSYISGYSNYVANNYTDALSFFELSLAITKTAYYSDDCYYLEAHCYISMGDGTKAADLLKKLIDGYPDSNLINEAKADYAKILAANPTQAAG